MGLWNSLKGKLSARSAAALAPPADPVPSIPIALRNYLDLVVLAHGPFSRMLTQLAINNGVLCVTADDVTPSAGAVSTVINDAHLLVALRNAAVTELAHALAASTAHPFQMIQMVEVTSVPGGYDVALLGVNGDRSELVRLGPVPAEVLLFSPAQLAELAADEATLQSGAARLRDLTETHTSKAWDQRDDPHQLSFKWLDGRAVTLPCAVLGSYSTVELSWCWAHHNSSFPRDASAKMRELCGALAPHEAPTLLGRPGFRAESGIAWAAARLATRRLGHDAVFCWPLANKPVQLFFAVQLP